MMTGEKVMKKSLLESRGVAVSGIDLDAVNDRGLLVGERNRGSSKSYCSSQNPKGNLG